MKKLITLSVIFFGLVVATIFLKFSQDDRNLATTSGTSLYFSPSSQSGKVGDEFPLGIIINTNEDSVSAAELHLSYDSTAIEITGFTNGNVLPVVLTAATYNQGVITVTLGSQPTTPFKGSGILGTLKVKIISAKNSSITFVNTTQIAAIGKNLNDLISSTGINIIASILSPTATPRLSPTLTPNPTSTPIPTISNSPTLTPIPTPTDIPGDTSLVLNYKIVFAKVNPDNANCAVNWPLQFTVLASGQSMTYSNVIPQNRQKANNQLVFSGSLRLTGFNQTSDIAIFIKGPKHLQVKYGKNNQSSVYNQAGGEITLTNNVNTSPVYDFTAYPLLAGDVTGPKGTPDGVIDGLDFSYVKTQSIGRASVEAGGNMPADLNGNCKMESQDLSILMLSLSENQDQLY